MSYLTGQQQDLNYPTFSNTLKRDETGRYVRGHETPAAARRRQFSKTTRSKRRGKGRDHNLQPTLTYEGAIRSSDDRWTVREGVDMSYRGPEWQRHASGTQGWEPQHGITQGWGRPEINRPSYPVSRPPPANWPERPYSAPSSDLTTRRPQMPQEHPYFASPQFKRYHLPGYAGHIQTEQFEFAKSRGQISREVLAYREQEPKPYYHMQIN